MTFVRSHISRRSFLEVCGGSAAIAWWLQSGLARAQGAGGIKRFMVIHRPNGSIHEDWIRDGKPGPILEPFAPVWSNTVALRGVNVRPSNGSTGGSHESGLVTIMTGATLGPRYRTNDDFSNTAPSLEQSMLKTSPFLKGPTVGSIQSGVYCKQGEIPNMTLSYSAVKQPLYPVVIPNEVYKRVFGAGVMPGGPTPANNEALDKARANRRSVLDFVRNDLSRVRPRFPASFREDLDAHATAIRELEAKLDAPAAGPVAGCRPPSGPSTDMPSDQSSSISAAGAQHLAIITAAFACDLTRVVTFMWGAGASQGRFPELGVNGHHGASHRDERPGLSAVDKWYSEKTAPFIKSLVDTPDPAGGKLIDNTLVWYINECSRGSNHSFNDYPFLLFGGDGVGLRSRGRIFDVTGQDKTSNDVWASLAPAFKATLTFSSKGGTALPGLFV
jgi:hypothetical protein